MRETDEKNWRTKAFSVPWTVPQNLYAGMRYGLLIVGINIVGGIIIGVAQRDMAFGDAMETFTRFDRGRWPRLSDPCSHCIYSGWYACHQGWCLGANG